MKNIVFDLGGVVFARDPRTCRHEVLEFFSFIREDPMPEFWMDFDRGLKSFDEVCRILAERSGEPYDRCREYLEYSIAVQRTIPCTGALIADLKAAGYNLYVLSNMAPEFIAFLRQTPVYGLFDGDVVSCEVRMAKPDPRIYELLISRFDLDPSETLFVDDRRANVEAAVTLGINGYRFGDPERSCKELRRILL